LKLPPRIRLDSTTTAFDKQAFLNLNSGGKTMARRKSPDSQKPQDEPQGETKLVRLASDDTGFKVEGKGFVLTGRMPDGNLQSFEAVAGRTRLQVSSDKCDWRISADVADLQAKVDVGGTRWSVGGRAGGFGGMVSSDKCDWRIRVNEDLVTNPAEITLTRENISGALDLNANLPTMRLMASSSKCDWRIKFRDMVSNPDPDARATLINRTDLTLSGNLGGDMSDLTANMPGMRTMASSSKCDWNIRLRPEWLTDPDPDVTFEVNPVAGRLDVAANLQSVRMAASSSKCDWNIRMNGDAVSNPADIAVSRNAKLDQIEVRSNLPNIRSQVSSSKCDWNIITQSRFDRPTD
jgi:hypothetical protein